MVSAKSKPTAAAGVNLHKLLKGEASVGEVEQAAKLNEEGKLVGTTEGNAKIEGSTLTNSPSLLPTGWEGFALKVLLNGALAIIGVVLVIFGIMVAVKPSGRTLPVPV